ncbi:Limulus clotting factor C, partial [Stegodyphus mimosarum]
MANLPVLSNDACMNAYANQNLPVQIRSGMFCAGFEEGRSSACTGDSGSPMVFYDGRSTRYIIEGLVSFGVSGQCGLPGRYTVFTRVSEFLPWIIRQMAS